MHHSRKGADYLEEKAMNKKDKYIKDLQIKMKKYKHKILEIDAQMKQKRFRDKPDLLSESKSLKEKFKQAEHIFKKLSSASQENFEEIKESSVEIFDALKEAFRDFSSLLTMDQVYHTKDDIVEYGNEKVAEVEKYIKKKPLVSAACALGIGFLIGKILTRSK